ncbi:MAG: DUF4249 family protein [Bacteroidota bacterium]
MPRIIVYITFIFFYCITSCEIDMYSPVSQFEIPGNELSIESTVFVQGIVHSRKEYQTVFLTTSFALGEQPDSISGAIVHVQIGDSVYPYIESMHHPNFPEELHQKGLYVSTEKFAGKVGGIHTLYISYDGKEYCAQDSMIAVCTFNFEGDIIPNLMNTNIESFRFGGVFFAQEESFFITWKWYQMFGFDETGTWIPYKQVTANSYFFADIVSPDISAGSSGDITVGEHGSPQDSTIIATKHSMSDSYKTYLIQTMYESIWNTSFFSVTPANVTTNLSNGGLGFFAACDVTSKSILYKDLMSLAKHK